MENDKRALDIGTALVFMRSISGAVDVEAAKDARDDAEAAQAAAEAAAELAAERSFAVSVSGTRLVFTSTTD